MNTGSPSSVSVTPTAPKNDWKADLKLAVGPYIKNLVSLSRGKLADKRIFFDPNTQEEVTIQGAQQNEIPGYFYSSSKEGPSPAILLLHGSTPAGKQMGLYRLLAHRLSGLGYAVLTIDQRGHGKANPPNKLDSVEDLDFAADAMLALDYLKQRPEVDSKKTYLLGHSFGGDVAITAGARDIDTNKILAYGPGRRYEERVQNELAYFCRRFTRYMKLSQLLPAELYLQTIGSQLLESHLGTYTSADHVPLMLIDGERESREDRHFLGEISSQLSDRVMYKTVPKADHYANVAYFGRFVIYDRIAFELFLEEIADWFCK